MQLLKNINLRGLMNNKTTEKLYTISESDLNKIKDETIREATDKAFALMLAIPTMVLHDHEWHKHKTDIPEFVDKCLDLYDSYDKGYVSFEDMIKTLEEESGIRITKHNKRRHG